MIFYRGGPYFTRKENLSFLSWKGISKNASFFSRGKEGVFFYAPEAKGKVGDQGSCPLPPSSRRNFSAVYRVGANILKRMLSVQIGGESDLSC